MIVGRTTFDVAAGVMREDAADALTDALEYLLEEANRTAPIEENIMIGSGQVSVDRDALRGTISYDTAYTVRQHEDLTLKHDPGRRAKWLERTWNEQGQRIATFMANRIGGRSR